MFDRFGLDMQEDERKLEGWLRKIPINRWV